MYTTQPCSAPSSTPIPTAILTTAISAAQSNIAAGGTIESAGTAVQAAIQTFLTKNPTATDPNLPRVARSAGYQAACKAILGRRIRDAQGQFNRLTQRTASDFAGTKIQPGQFTRPQFGNPSTQASYSCDTPAAAPKIVPIMNAFNYTPAPAPLVTQPMQKVQPIPPAQPAGAPAPAQPDCQTGNICIDLRNGCVLSSQVDVAQLLACAQAGYVGNLNKYPAIAARGGARGGAFIGSPMLNPPPFNPGMGALRRNPARPMRRVA
jgi:hypothetical protein